MRWPPRIFFLADGYLSFQLTAAAYRRALSRWATLVDSPSQADVTIILGGPGLVGDVHRLVPAVQRTYIIGITVFEARNLSCDRIASLQGADELWLPSFFCMDIFRGHHRRLTWLPHIVEAPAPVTRPTADEATMLAALDLQTAGRFVFVAMVSLLHRRKGAHELLRAFRALRPRAPHVTLVIKSKVWRDRAGGLEQVAMQAPLEVEPGVVVVGGGLSYGGMEGLWSRADALVSAHHSEGWGLALSDAMARGVPVVATHYSGNCDFMTAHNSLPVYAQERFVTARETELWFATSMRWGGILPEDLERQMGVACRVDGAAQRRRLADRARADIACFGPAPVGRRMRALIAEVVRRVRRAGGLEAWRAQASAQPDVDRTPAPLSRG